MSFGSFSLRELTWMHCVIWRCEHTRFCVEGFYALHINFHSFIQCIVTHTAEAQRGFEKEGCCNPVQLLLTAVRNTECFIHPTAGNVDVSSHIKSP